MNTTFKTSLLATSILIGLSLSVPSALAEGEETSLSETAASASVVTEPANTIADEIPDSGKVAEEGDAEKPPTSDTNGSLNNSTDKDASDIINNEETGGAGADDAMPDNTNKEEGQPSGESGTPVENNQPESGDQVTAEKPGSSDSGSGNTGLKPGEGDVVAEGSEGEGSADGNSTMPDNTNKEEGQPSADSGTPAENTDKEEGQPSGDSGTPAENTDKEEGQPSADSGTPAENTDKEEGQPSADSGTSAENTNKEEGQPSADSGTSAENTNKEEGQPSADSGTSAENNQPQSGDQVTAEKPGSSDSGTGNTELKPEGNNAASGSGTANSEGTSGTGAEGNIPPAATLPPGKHSVTTADLAALGLTDPNKPYNNTVALTLPEATPGTKDNKLTLGEATPTTLNFATSDNKPALSIDDKLAQSDSVLLQNLSINNVNNGTATTGLSIAAIPGTDGTTGTIELKNVNISVNNKGATTAGAKAEAIVVSGKSINVKVDGSNIKVKASNVAAKKNALVFTEQSGKNSVTFSGSAIQGDILDLRDNATTADSNTVTLSGSSLQGDVHSAHTPDGDNYLRLILNNSSWSGRSYDSPDLEMTNSTWNVLGKASVNSMDLAGVNMLNFGNATGDATRLLAVEKTLALKEGTQTRVTGNGLLDLSTATFTGNGSLVLRPEMPSTGSEPAVTAEGYIANGTGEADSTAQTFSVLAKAADLTRLDIADSTTERGLYQYRTVKTLTGSRYDVVYASSGRLSNSAATVASLAAAPASIAAMESDALAKQISSQRHSKGTDASVWISYYGGANKNSLKAGTQYDLKTNGVMLGVDARIDEQWKAGVALNTAKSTLSVLNSNGDITSYGGQLWFSWQHSSGIFVDGSAQIGHYSNTAKARMTDGTPGRSRYATNGYGVAAKLGYAYQNAGFYAEPYLQAAGRSFSGEAYQLSNDMAVNNADYKSFLGEIGTNLGYTMTSASGYFKPYLHLAVLNEFLSSNKTRINDRNVPNSINGAAFRVGVGGEVKLLQNLGGYASVDYTKGGDIARPWQINVGVSYSW